MLAGMTRSGTHSRTTPRRRRDLALSVGLELLTVLTVVMGGLGVWLAGSVDWLIEPWWAWFCMIVSGSATVVLALLLGTMARDAASRRHAV
jgi:hypothetical protein